MLHIITRCMRPSPWKRHAPHLHRQCP